MKPSCLIIDDEAAARTGLAEDIIQQNLFLLKGTATGAENAKKFLRENPVDLLFVDIEMGDINGLEFIKGLEVKPMIVITTAYPQYALQGYEHNVIDYLLKPISPERLRIASEKALSWYNILLKTNNEIQDYVFLKCDGEYRKILHNEIIFVEAANNYIFIHTKQKKYLIYHSLKKFKQLLPENKFVQVHKSFIVAKDEIQEIKGNIILCHKRQIPLNRHSRKLLLKEIAIKK